MKGSLLWRALVALAVALLGLAYLLPSIPAVSHSVLGRILPGNQISLGLDLKGGIHLNLEVDVKKALENNLATMGRDLRATAREQELSILKPEVQAATEKLSFVLVDTAQQDKVDELLRKNFRNLDVEAKVPAEEGRVRYLLSLRPEAKKELMGLTVDQAVKTIRNRIDQFGVAEPDIRKQEGGRIQVQLPGLTDPARAIAIIGKTAHLEFRVVDDNADPAKLQQGMVPLGKEILPLRRVGQKPGQPAAEGQIMVSKEAALTGENIVDATVNTDQMNRYAVGLTFNAQGARDFERVTAENVRKQLAIVLDGVVYSAPVINEKISGGRASITGNFTVDDARDLAVVLRAGSLPAPVKVVEQRTVGPSLGQESIDKGVTSALAGLGLVMFFMAVYYRVGGLFADLALLLNMVLILAGLALFGATLTLPGIAGIILTIGMSVDANVLIFERIREEVRKGLTPLMCVDVGFSRATLTILDANVTTLIAAMVLYEFGTGPVRGFAVTLCLGIAGSMFAAIFFSRVLFDLYLRGREKASLNI